MKALDGGHRTACDKYDLLHKRRDIGCGVEGNTAAEERESERHFVLVCRFVIVYQ